MKGPHFIPSFKVDMFGSAYKCNFMSQNTSQ